MNIEKVINNFKKYFSSYFTSVKFIVIEQCDDTPFKKGQLYNIALNFVDSEYIGLIDNDSWNFCTFDPIEVYNDFGGAYVAFDKISQIRFVDSYVEILKTDERPYGFGMYVFMQTSDFINANGFSNLCLGWGAEDNIFGVRAKLKRYTNTLGHIAHEKRNNLFPKLSTHNREIYMKYMIEELNPALDGLKQTSYHICYDKHEKDVRYIGVDNIGVYSNFAYKKEMQEIDDIITEQGKTFENGLSICVTAYKSVDYIKKCLDSIKTQRYFLENNNWECLIGIDGCEETLECCKSIMPDYDSHFRFFMMDSNKGTYITTNTLMKIAKYKYLLRFDSDDYMPDNFIEEMMWEIRDNDFMRMRFETTDERRWQSNAYGCVVMTKELFEKVGGYMPWPCAADKELAVRIQDFAKCGFSRKAMYYRVIRDDSLQHDSKTGMHSEIRAKFHQYIDTQSANNLYIECVTNSYTEIK